MTGPETHRRPIPFRFDVPASLPVLLLLLITLPLQAQRPAISIQIPPGDTLMARPGSVLAVPVRLTNTTPQALSARLALKGDPGWRSLTGVTTVQVPAGATILSIPMVSLPARTHGGFHALVVEATASGEVRAEKIVWVRVATTIRIEGRILDAPRFSVAGDDIVVSCVLMNEGNDTTAVRVGATSSLGYQVRDPERTIRIPPGDQQTVTLSVVTPLDERQRRQHSLVITARPQTEGSTVTLAPVTEIVPRTGHTGPERFSFPVFATLRGTTEEGTGGMQAEILGAGPLSEDGTDRFEMLLRGPETRTVSPLGYQDEYRVRYETGDSKIYAGDWNYTLTPLTEVGRYAAGLGAESAFGDMTVGGYVNRSRFGVPVRRQVAGWGRYAVTEEIDLGLNVLNASGPRAGTVATASGSARVFANSRLELETGTSGGGSDAMAYAVRLRGAVPWGVFDIRSVGAGADYTGYYRDIRFSSVSLTGFATREIRTEFSARTEQRNLNADSLRGGSPTTGFIQVGAGYSNYLTLSYRMSGTSDPFALFPYDRREDILQVRSSVSFAGVSASAYVDVGSLRDRARNATSPSTRYAMSLSASPLAGQSYNASLELARTRDIATGQETERLAGSLGANLILGERTRADVTAYASRSTGISVQYALLDASVEHVFPFAHRAAVRYRRSEFTGVGASNAVSLEYGIPVAIPLGVKKGVGSIRGRVTDATGAGIAEVLVSAGSVAAVTDDDGRFIIPGLPPGSQFITVDRATIGLDRITAVPLPLEVDVRGGEESIIPLVVIPAASLRGQVRAFDFDPAVPVDSFGLIPRPIDASTVLLVELSNGTEFHRRRTDSRGKFSFGDLRPGTWTMQVSPLSLPQDHVIERPSATVEVSMGDELDMILRVLPRRRAIRVIQQGGVLQAAPEPAEDTETRYGRFIIRKSPARGGYFVQTAAFAVEEMAQNESRRLERATGRKAAISATQSQGGARYYRIEFGPFETSAAAKVFCDTLPR